MKNLIIVLCSVFLSLAVGCRDSSSHGHAHDQDHAPPHGGTPVVIGGDKFHLELVHDATVGKMQAYVLDGHLESYVQVPETSFVLVAKVGEQADWLKTAKEFAGSIPTITLNGATFTKISFPFPKGTKHVH